jgi:TRAP-type C4-dicarboxylate transport system permease small subunit
MNQHPKSTSKDRRLLNRILKSLDYFLKGSIIVLLAGMTVSIILQVFFRYVVNRPLIWPEEFARMLMIWSIFLASFYALIEGGHIGLNFVKKRFSKRVAKIMDITSHLLMLGFLLIMVIKGAESTVAVADEYTPTLVISTAIPYASMPVSGLLMMLVVIRYLIDDFKKN